MNRQDLVQRARLPPARARFYAVVVKITYHKRFLAVSPVQNLFYQVRFCLGERFALRFEGLFHRQRKAEIMHGQKTGV